MENIKKKIVLLKNELSSCKDRTLYTQTLESHIAAISNDILSDPSLSKKFDENSKLFFLSNRLKDTLKRKELMDKTDPEERTEKISEFIEQINSEALMYAEDIFSTLLTELGIPNDLKAPSSQVENTSILHKVATRKKVLNQPNLMLHMMIVFGMVVFIVWFHWMSV